jgi:hypothetical protein
MTIEIQKPELQALIQEQLQTGSFEGIEDLLMHSLVVSSYQATGAALFAAMQACPVKDVDLEPERFPMPVRDVNF